MRRTELVCGVVATLPWAFFLGARWLLSATSGHPPWVTVPYILMLAAALVSWFFAVYQLLPTTPSRESTTRTVGIALRAASLIGFAVYVGSLFVRFS